jgi:uncharacterized protein YbdZ (MbtH family)
MTDDAEDQTIYQVVLNDEEQYSIWPADRDLPAGWRPDGTTGPKAGCLAHIDEVWKDMRPLSLRKYMEEQERAPAATGPQPSDEAAEEEEEESLVSRLSRGDHPVEISLRPQSSPAALSEAIDRGYVFVRFTGTRGGTELGVELDRAASDLAAADYEAGSGQISLVGDLTLDFEPVRCVAEIDLATMSGNGRLTAALASGQAEGTS